MTTKYWWVDRKVLGQKSLGIEKSGYLLEGDMGEVISQKRSHFSLFQAQGELVLHGIYRKNFPKDYHFSSKLQRMVKTSPCFITPGF